MPSRNNLGMEYTSHTSCLWPWRSVAFWTVERHFNSCPYWFATLSTFLSRPRNTFSIVWIGDHYAGSAACSWMWIGRLLVDACFNRVGNAAPELGRPETLLRSHDYLFMWRSVFEAMEIVGWCLPAELLCWMNLIKENCNSSRYWTAHARKLIDLL